MGFFSWKTADTGESISNVHGERECRTVYLLQPGKPPIEETAYDGYGIFGGVDAYVWLARQNIPSDRVAGMSDDVLGMIGCQLDCGGYVQDVETGKRYSIFHDASAVDPGIIHLGKRWDDPLEEFGGKGANQLVQEGRFENRDFDVGEPLKFSFDPGARYEDLPASESCPHQGIYYDDDDDDGEED